MNGPPYSALAVPEPLNEDDDDIRWALHTAGVQWRRGAREDAIAWVRRGADAAVDGGFWERASQLNVAAAALERALGVPAGSQAPIASSRPRGAPPVPSPVSPPVAVPAQRSASPAAPPIKATPLSRPPSVRVPASSSSVPSSRWPTGFPKGPPAPTTPSGRAIAPPPPLPGAVRQHKAPIPPPPKSGKPRERVRDSMVDIEISTDEVELSEEENLALQQDVVEHDEHTDPSIPAMNSSPLAGALPSYGLDEDEDPLDGTTALPAETPYVSSYPADSLDGQALPAFPLDESSPPAAPTLPPPLTPSPLRQKPPTQFGSVKPAGFGARSAPPTPTSQRPLGTHNIARWASHDEPKEVVRRGPSQMSPRATPSVRSPAEPARAARRGSSVPPASTGKSAQLPSIKPLPPVEVDDTLLEPIVPAAPDAVYVDVQHPEEERTKISEQDPMVAAIQAVPADEPGKPPSTARGLGQLGSVPPDALLDEELAHSSAVTQAPPALAPLRAAAAPVAAPASLPALTISDLPSIPPIADVPVVQTESEPAPPVMEEAPPSSSASEVLSSASSNELLEGPLSNPVPSIHGIVLADVRGLCDLPEDAQRVLRQRARIERMGTGEDLSFFSVVLVLEGWVKLMPAIADTTCATASAGDVVFTQGSLEEGIALRVTAGQNGTTLATWDKATFSEITETCPWVSDELRLIADSFQALAGTTLGALGERLDDSLREVVTSRCRVLTLMSHDVLVEAGKPVPGMHIVGAGLVELLDPQGTVVKTCAPGDFLLVEQVMAGGKSPHTARAASGGALVLFAPRIVAHELLVSVPPLLEILAG